MRGNQTTDPGRGKEKDQRVPRGLLDEFGGFGERNKQPGGGSGEKRGRWDICIKTRFHLDLNQRGGRL